NWGEEWNRVDFVHDHVEPVPETSPVVTHRGDMDAPLPPRSHDLYAVEVFLAGRPRIACDEPLHVIAVCHQTACHLVGKQLGSAASRVFGVAPAENEDAQLSAAHAYAGFTHAVNSA